MLPYLPGNLLNITEIACPYSQFADGCSYNKTKLEQLFRNGFFDRTAPKALKVAPGKKEDVEVIVSLSDINSLL
jgi:hypothetical protein